MKYGFITSCLFLMSFGLFGEAHIFYYEGTATGGPGRRSYVVNECHELPKTVGEHSTTCPYLGGFVRDSSGKLWQVEGSLALLLPSAPAMYTPVGFDAVTGVLDGRRMVFCEDIRDADRIASVDAFFMKDREIHFEQIKQFLAERDLSPMPLHLRKLICRALGVLRVFADCCAYSTDEVLGLARLLYDTAHELEKSSLAVECGIDLFFPGPA